MISLQLLFTAVSSYFVIVLVNEINTNWKSIFWRSNLTIKLKKDNCYSHDLFGKECILRCPKCSQMQPSWTLFWAQIHLRSVFDLKYIHYQHTHTQGSPRSGRWSKSRWIHQRHSFHSRSQSATCPSSTEKSKREDVIWKQFPPKSLTSHISQINGPTESYQQSNVFY